MVLNDILDLEHVYERIFIHIKIKEQSVINIYKPTNENWLNNDLMSITYLVIIACYFNSHHKFWCYDNNDPNGDTLNEWAKRENVSLVFDAKDKGTFRSGRWQRDYNPDLCFITKDHRL